MSAESVSTARPVSVTPPARAISPQRTDERFFLIMAFASSAIVFLGFSRTYYLKSYFGTPPLRGLLHVHAMVFTTWMIFFVLQTALIASNRRSLHRLLGYAGGVLACAMIVLGLLVAFSTARLGQGNRLRNVDAVFLISLGDILTFALFVGAGFLWRHDRETHQRVMLLAVVAGLLSAAVGRLPLIGGHPAALGITGLAFLLAGPIYDFIMRRRIHPAYIWGCLFALVTFVPVRIALAATPTWHHIAKWLISL
jgi:hypothetical protein